jgi:hypothetical protein
MYGILARSAQKLGLVQGPKNTAFKKRMLKKRSHDILRLCLFYINQLYSSPLNLKSHTELFQVSETGDIKLNITNFFYRRLQQIAKIGPPSRYVNKIGHETNDNFFWCH